MGVGSGVEVLERERDVVEVYAGGRGRSVLIESLPEATLAELVNRDPGGKIGGTYQYHQPGKSGSL